MNDKVGKLVQDKVEKLAQDLVKKHGKAVEQLSLGDLNRAMDEAGVSLSPFEREVLIDWIFELVNELGV